MKWDCFPLLNSKNFQYKPNFLSLVTKWNYENAEKNGRASYPNKVNWAPQAASLASASWMKSRRNHNNYWWIQAIKLIAIYLITMKKRTRTYVVWYDKRHRVYGWQFGIPNRLTSIRKSRNTINLLTSCIG